MPGVVTTNRVARFLWLAGKEFIPDKVKLPFALARHFRDCFLVTSPKERLELYAQLDAADADEAREIETLILDEWSSILPAGRELPPDTDQLVRGLVESLRAAANAHRDGQPETRQLRGLSAELEARVLGGRKALPATNLDAQQRQLGRLVVSSALRANPTSEAPWAFPSIPGYEIKRFLKEGGFGQVFLAYHPESESLRAVKVGDASEHKRLERELEVAKGFQSPHLVRYLDHGTVEGQYWIAMDYLSEQTLADVLSAAGGKLEPELALSLGEQILLGLSELHAARVIHRDLTLNNVMVDQSFRLRLIDFGLARPLASETGQTTTGAIVGTPHYMSLEQLRGDSLSAAADVYSFGVVLYKLLTGGVPHEGVNIVQQAFLLERKPTDAKRPEVPPELTEFLSRCVSSTANRRYTDGREALTAYRTVVAEYRTRARYEQHASAWHRLLETDAIESWVEAHSQGNAADGAAAARAFAAHANERGLAPVDEVRLAEILPLALNAREPIVRALAALSRMKSACETLMSALFSEATPEELKLLSEAVRLREKAVSEARIALKSAVRTALHHETQSWEEHTRRLKAERRERAKQVELDKLKREEQDERERISRRLLAVAEAEARKARRRAIYGRLAALISFFLVWPAAILLGWGLDLLRRYLSAQIPTELPLVDYGCHFVLIIGWAIGLLFLAFGGLALFWSCAIGVMWGPDAWKESIRTVG